MSDTACNHDWCITALSIDTDLAEKKPVFCATCGKRRAWRAGKDSGNTVRLVDSVALAALPEKP